MNIPPRPAQPKLRNIGPKSAAWLRQVGLRTREDLAAAGPIKAFMRVKRAGFKPSMNLLYSLEGALLDCHWQEVPEHRRAELVAAAEAAIADLPPPRYRPAASPVTTRTTRDEGMPALALLDPVADPDHTGDG
jgi:TfoX/Sxy family transcriptional regulator of competence genes